MPQLASSPSAIRRPSSPVSGRSRERALGLRSRPERKGKQSRGAVLLEEQLNKLLEEHRKCAPLREILMEAIQQVHGVATRDRKSERDAVCKAIFDQGARTMKEIIEDTRLGFWAVLGVVEELVMEDLVEMREKFYLAIDGQHEGEKAIEYHPLHTTP